MRIGIDFDNTIIGYDKVFCHLAKAANLVADDYAGSKRELREIVQASSEGDLAWQRLQGKAYGEFINVAEIFAGFKEFIAACNRDDDIEVFIVSHKTELGHHDDKRINLRNAAREWLREQGFFGNETPFIKEENVFFETTREEKIARIKALNCTHFIDDLPEVLFAPSFPPQVERFWFQPEDQMEMATHAETKIYTNWIDIKNAIFAS
jgi:hypothetical protein